MTRPTISGLYAVTPDLDDTARLAAMAAAALQGGVRLLQYRNKAADQALRAEQARMLLPLCRQAGVPLIINDHVALCAEIDADGVHLGGEDGALSAARAVLGAGKLIGASCYDGLALAVRAKAEGADYVAFGACFDSATKPAAVRAPLALFAEARRVVGLPTVAIGGITADNAHLAIAAGADALAVINGIFAAPDIRRAAQHFSNLFARVSP